MVSSDAELVRAAQEGNAASLGLLLERHRASLYALALPILGRSPDAQDAVQETCLIALRQIGQVRDPQAVGGWLRTILRNVCLRALRKRGETTLFGERTPRLEQEASDLSAEETIDRLALRDWVWTALSELPEALRVTAMLRYFGSYASYEEISTILNVPVGTVKSRLNQVKVKLADALLKATGLAHDEARRLTEHHTRFFAEVTEAHNRGEVSGEFLDTFSRDVVGVFAGKSFRGSEVFYRALREDTEAGVKLYPTNVLASEGVVVYEGEWENPPEDPFHCPPGMSQVEFLQGGRVHETYVYHAPRPASSTS